MSPARAPDHEARWLQSAERAAGARTFTEHALIRLDAGEVPYGDRWAQVGLDKLITELSEEAADLGAWGVLALQALDHETSVCAVARAAIATRLHAAILAGARAHRQLELARTDLHRMAQLRPRRFTPDVDGRCLNCGRGYGAHADNGCRPGLDEFVIGEPT